MDRTTLVQLLSDLVATRSVNRFGRREAYASSLRVVEYLQGWFERRGIECRRQAVPGGEQNLVASVPGAVSGPTLLFDAHTDTVPAEGWEDRAFTPRFEDGKLYGRGSCDTKASMTAMMVALAAAARQPLPFTILFLASADEEHTRTGIKTFIDSRPRVDGVIVGEPSSCRPVTACKGAVRWQIVTEGKTAHSSTPRKGLNAVVRMAEVLRAIEQYNEDVLSRKSHPLVDAATMTPTVIRGGTAANIVPGECQLSVDLRTMPDEDPAAAMLDAKAYLAERVSFPLRHECVKLWSGANVPDDHALVRHCLNCAAVEGAPPPRPKGVNYGCHASDFSDVGIPAVVLGPGDIAQAHAVDEYVEIDSVERAAEIYFRIMTTPAHP